MHAPSGTSSLTHRLLTYSLPAAIHTSSTLGAQWLIFYAEPFLAWLQLQQADELAPRFAADELSVGLSKLRYDFEAGLHVAGQLQRVSAD